MTACSALLLLIVCVFAPGFCRAQFPLYAAAQGEDVTLSFVFQEPGNWRILCKNDCNKVEDRYVVTSNDSVQIGRYSVRYVEQYPGHNVMMVGIVNVSSSDQGLYRCLLEQWRETTMIHYGYSDFWIQVITAPSSPPAPASTPSDPSLSNGTSSSGASEPQSCPAAAPGALLFVALALTAVVLTLVALTFVCRKRKLHKPQPAATENCPESKVEDYVMYAQVDFSRSSSSSAPRWRSEAVVYSVPQLQAQEAPVYSSVSLPQNGLNQTTLHQQYM